ncbi:MAG: dihydroorotase [Fimbriimonadaceae bacterium]|nr:dihydroorotase [Fimbriimonadaceae bacterium]
MQFDLLVRGGTLATANGTFEGDIGIAEGRIAAVGALDDASAAEVLDATHLTVLPGVIDSHTHMREPGLEQKENLASGTRAAVLGGVTTLFEMPNTTPPTVSREALEDKLSRARGRAWTDHAFYIGATLENIEALAELETLPGACGVKLFMGSSTGDLLVSEDPDVLRVLKSGTRRIAVHSEDEPRLRERIAAFAHPKVEQHPLIRDSECARLATERLIRMCEETRRPVHILHVSTAEEIPLIVEAKRRGLPVSAEVCPQHLFFAAPDCYTRLGTRAQQNPPLRDATHQAALRAALAAGVFDTVGTDHAPHLVEEKARPYPLSPSGMPGVQTLVPVMLTLVSQGVLGLGQFVRAVSEGPVRLFAIEGKGALAEGMDADLTVVDLEAERVLEQSWIASRCGWSPYLGERLRGWPVHTVVRGAVAVRDGELFGNPSGVPVRFGRMV